MKVISTAAIRTARALGRVDGEQCASWATSMLERGVDTPHLRKLAGVLPPFNPFELAAIRDRALEEIGCDSDDEPSVSEFSAELLRDGLDGSLELTDAVRQVGELCFTQDQHRAHLFDFYLLAHAHDDLAVMEVSGYWPDAMRENIGAIMRERAQQFVKEVLAEASERVDGE